MSAYADAARARAAQLDHEWDQRAIDWPLTAESVVVEVGGYIGRWALQIAERYAPRIYVFEPQPWAYGVCCEVLRDRAEVYNVALGTTDAFLSMGEWGTDGCSFVKTADGPQVQMSEIGWVLRNELGLDRIDLMLINIEGYEYTLIPHMVNCGILPERLMVQMHSFAGDSDALRAILAKHYRLRWDYGDVLTAWERT